MVASYYLWVVALLVITLTFKYFPSTSSDSPSSPSSEDESLISKDDNANKDNKEEDEILMREFKIFQKWYIIIFLVVMLADWMQGPYVYKLYASYGISTKDIAVLFVIGFGTSGITGAIIGSLADRFGRKNMCILFCIFYAVSCGTKHSQNYNILIIGRFLGGISTSILFSCFESWMVTHHHFKGYPSSKLGDTFEKAWSLNSFIAILAGIITSYAVSYYEKYDLFKDKPHEIAAFDCSAVTLIIALFLINYKWKIENYGDTTVDLKNSLINAANLFKNDKSILLVGIIQSGFESAMYLFVFMWTMALEQTSSDDETIDHGMIFAVFMEACLVGTTISSKLTSITTEKIAFILCLIAGIALIYIPHTNNYEFRLFTFIIFECCVGVYFPTIGGLRGKYVPDNVRATIMNIFRIPLNIIVVIVLWYIDSLGLEKVFHLASILLFIASAASYALNLINISSSSNKQKTNGH